jgi:hypothetical protein
LVAVIAMIVGVRSFAWGNPELSAMYIVVALAIAVVGAIPSRDAAQAFLRGMQGMLLAGVLVGLAAAVEVVLRESMVLDSIVASLSGAVAGKSPSLVAVAMMGVQMVIDVFIPSTSGKAAITMPILGPIAHISGVSGQVTVQAFLFGNGLMNTLTPTQSLALFNGDETADQAAHWAGRLLAESFDDDQLVRRAWLEVYSRLPTSEELAGARQFLTTQADLIYAAETNIPTSSQPQLCPSCLEPHKAAAYVDLCHALMNSTEFLFVD